MAHKDRPILVRATRGDFFVQVKIFSYPAPREGVWCVSDLPEECQER